MARGTVPPESAFAGGPYDDPTMAWRRDVLRQTLAALAAPGARDRYLELARANLSRWSSLAGNQPTGPEIRVLAGDWGTVTLSLTRELGETFAVLNMANAHWPGGAYLEGTVAQEENMFRRTDCHFALSSDGIDAAHGGYRPAMTDLINGAHGEVYLDTGRPRVCIRGPETPSTPPTGYPWLPEDEVFAFLELRAAARDYRHGGAFDESDARRRIVAQLETLIGRGVRHAVLGASGCGAFRNPADAVASIYAEELLARLEAFDCVAFAIYHAGYGPNNLEPFERVLAHRVKTPHCIDGNALIERLPEILAKVENGAAFEVLCGPSSFVLGPPSLGHVFSLIDEGEYGWPMPTDVGAIGSIEDVAPSRRRHPLLTRHGQPIAMSISVSEYECLLARDTTTQG